MTPFPTLFISHGSPMLAMTESPAHRFLQELGKTLPRPRAILVVSAHWESMQAPAVSLAQRPTTIHDFGDFPPALFAIEYQAPGAPEVAARAANLLEQAGFSVKRSPDHGLDHGTWVPLRLMYPDADIPVFQVSVVRDATPEVHAKMGTALGALRQEGVLIIGSGSITHNLQEFRGQAIDAPAPSWVSDFGNWISDMLHAGRRDALLDYRRQAPFAERNHPTEEHLLPLFVTMGAAGDQVKAERLHTSYEHGVLAMDVYAFS